MPLKRPEDLVWYHTDGGVLPDAADRPWAKVGLGTPTIVDDGLKIDTSSPEILGYYRQFIDSDTSSTAARTRDRVVLQATVKGVSVSAGWASGASPIGLSIDDGNRKLAVSVGSSLQLVDPTTGTVIHTITTGFHWLFANSFRLVKDGTTRWQLYVQGVLEAELPYLAAPASTATPASVFVGNMDASGQSDGRYNDIEYGVNQDPPFHWKVLRAQRTMLAPIQSRWTRFARAILRAGLGMLQHVQSAMEGAWTEITAARMELEEFTFTGDVLPEGEETPWTLVGASGDRSIVRQRLRFASSTADVLYRAAFAYGTPPTDVEVTTRATFIVRSYTPDTDGRVGPYVEVSNGHRAIAAQLVKVDDHQHAWVLTDADYTGPFSIFGTSQKTLVDIYEPHTVELQVLGRVKVVLLLDGTPIDITDYSVFSTSTSNYRVDIARLGDAANPQCEVDVEHGLAAMRLTDLARRPLFLQTAVERLIFVSGCERNDLLDTWIRHHFEVQGYRGTTNGIEVELRRMCCNDQPKVDGASTAGDWYLEVTYPEVTPIWLEFDGVLWTVTVEFPATSPNFTPQQLADLAVRYLVPVSTLEFTYQMALMAVLTGSTVNGASYTDVPVYSSDYFEAGDAVTLRDSAGTTYEDTIIQSIVSSTTIRTNLLTGSFGSDDRIRKVLATS
jgi:hypothetical protein